MLQRRLGIFYVSRRDLTNDGFCHVLAKMLFVPQEVKFMYASKQDNPDFRSAFRLIGTSPLFDELSEAEAPPVYDLVITGAMNENVKVKVVRMEGEVF